MTQLSYIYMYHIRAFLRCGRMCLKHSECKSIVHFYKHIGNSNQAVCKTIFLYSYLDPQWWTHWLPHSHKENIWPFSKATLLFQQLKFLVPRLLSQFKMPGVFVTLFSEFQSIPCLLQTFSDHGDFAVQFQLQGLWKLTIFNQMYLPMFPILLPRVKIYLLVT